jgi:hypothetical protein
MTRLGGTTPRSLLALVVLALLALTVAAFVLAHVGGGHGIEKLF